MNSQMIPLSWRNTILSLQGTSNSTDATSHTPVYPPAGRSTLFANLSPFWRDRLIEGGLILSMLLYYIVGNPNLNIHLRPLSQLNPVVSLPFLLIFALLCWYRLPFAVALVPLSLPYYLSGFQKEVLRYGHTKLDFSLVEVTLWTCLAVALLQLVWYRQRWRYWLTWAEFRERIGPFALPILLFSGMAAFSIMVAYAHNTAFRSFREEVLDPLLYLVLALYCLRMREDVQRLLGALMSMALLISVLAIGQYIFFRHSLPPEADGIRRVHTVYGSANSIGLLLDYTLPLALAWLLLSTSWRTRILAAIVCLPLLIALYLSQSHGAWIAFVATTLFVLACAIRNRRLIMIDAAVVVIVLLLIVIAFPHLVDFIFAGHTNTHGVSTLQRRLYLWESAWNMIRAYPWFGVGMDNWLCYYSKNTICDAHAFHYWIVNYPPHLGTDTGLRDEPNLSHPHNIFLHVWVSMGIFGLIAFVAVLVLFYRLFVRMLMHLRVLASEKQEQLRWMIVGVGAAMFAALVQGMGDSAFLEQDLAFCFWMLVTALLLVRVLSGTAWRGARQ